MRVLETGGNGFRSPSEGPWLPWVVILLILGNTFCQVQGVLLHPPQNVTITSENFFLFLMWQPSLDFTNITLYEVETRDDSPSNWTKVTSCQGNKMKQTQRCELPLSDIFKIYEARVRAHDGARQSEWASSNLLQPYKDTIIGPLNLFLAATDDNLTVVISLPLTPLENDNSSKLFQFLQTLSYQMTLTEEGAELNKIKLKFNKRIIVYTYHNLMHSTNYCVKASAADQPAKESVQCIRMPGRPAGDNRILFIMVSIIVTGLVLLSVMARAFFKQHPQGNPAESTFPKSLTFLNLEQNGSSPALSPVLHLEESCIASVSAEVLSFKTNTASQQQRLQLIPRGCNAQAWSSYCARGCDASNWSIDSLSTGELEYLTGENYRPAPELTESSVHPSPSSARLLPHDAGTSCVSWNWECQIDNEIRAIGWSSSSRADIPLSSLMQQTMVDIPYSPGMHLVSRDTDVPQGGPIQQTTESEEHHEHPGFPKGSHLQDDSSLELSDMQTMSFSGYEFRQPILFCE